MVNFSSFSADFASSSAGTTGAAASGGPDSVAGMVVSFISLSEKEQWRFCGEEKERGGIGELPWTGFALGDRCAGRKRVKKKKLEAQGTLTRKSVGGLPIGRGHRLL